MVAHQTLTLFVRVRILHPLPSLIDKRDADKNPVLGRNFVRKFLLTFLQNQPYVIGLLGISTYRETILWKSQFLNKWAAPIIRRGVLRKEVQTKNSSIVTLFRRRSHSYAVAGLRDAPGTASPFLRASVLSTSRWCCNECPPADTACRLPCQAWIPQFFQ